MTEEIKINEELFLEIEKLKDELTENVIKIGRLRIEISLYEKDLHLMNLQLENLCGDAEKIRSVEIGLKKRLDEEYGPCEYNFETGTIRKL
jgi:hypothetical protein